MVDSEAAADMHGDALGLLLSVLLIALCLGLSFFVTRYGRRLLGVSCPEVARKIVHIGVSNWFFIYCFVFESDLWPMIGLGCFALINAYMNVSGLLGKLMAQDSTRRNWGLVQYPVAIIILILLKKLGVGDMTAMGCAVLGMGYGDGLASLVGKATKSKRLGSWTKKTVAGSLTMACITFIIVVLIEIYIGRTSFSSHLMLIGLLTSVVATAVEALTPFGLDNLSVPIAIYLILGFV